MRLTLCALLWTGAALATPAPERPTDAESKDEVQLDENLLKGIEDNKPVAFDGNRAEADAYNYVVVRAHKVRAAALARAAHKDVPRAGFTEIPAKYRGEVIALEGSLRRLRKFDASKALQDEGIKFLYEAWIYRKSEAQPFCVILTELPEGLEVGETVEREVRTDAYFFKLYGFKAASGVFRTAPLLIGRTLSLPAVKD